MYINQEPNPLKYNEIINFLMYQQDSPEKFAESDITVDSLAAWIKARNGILDCEFCGSKVEEIDHIVPLSKGGSHTFSNIRMLCRTCNRAKGTLMEDEFRKWIEAVKAMPSGTLG